jgi:AraC-like DNA-binding protein
MTGRVKNSDQLKQALMLRAAGYSLASISERTGISSSTLSRHFTKHKASKGGLTDEAVNEARRQLLDDAGFIGDIKSKIAASVADDISHVRAIREAISITLEETMAAKELPPHYRARSIAALATSIGLTQTAIRKALSVDSQPVDQDDLPTLFISELCQDEIDGLRHEQKMINEELGIIDDDSAGIVVETE